MWLMKNSVKIVKLFLFMPPRKVHCFTETMGKEEGEKEKDRTAKYSCRRSKGSPAPVDLFVVLERGGEASPVQYKFQSMHPGGCTCVNSLFPAFNIFQSMHPGGCNCVNSLFPVFNVHVE